MGTSNISSSGGAALLPFAVLAQLNDMDTARQIFTAAIEYYRRGEYEKAIEEFQKSYALSKKPELLYNIAICYEKLVRIGDAIAAYHFYLRRNPHADDKVAVESRIIFLEMQINPNTPAESKPKISGIPEPKDMTSAPAPEPSSIIDVYIPPAERIKTPSTDTTPHSINSKFRVLKWTSVALSAVGLVTGVTSYSLARKKQDQHDTLINNLIEQGEVTGSTGDYRFADAGAKERHAGELNGLENDVRVFEKISIGGFAGAVLSLSFGGFFFWLDRKKMQIVLKSDTHTLSGGVHVSF